ncbi:TetR family transcriptional regulator [Antricoccus suffuscus]|uniref:TetR family transcriptional regulator n=1 Tax=Antricoccus suffuscus TaxID=1629062 RepID=A0A2T0ZWP9_9ACTN|nr:TetR/AcrR family transcriptional regulator [Antricoccus suffuscus]PRZ40714.1 TetR family transcriptional regulator [Antricoccus suffuscus]
MTQSAASPPQQDRSRITQDRLLDAAVEALAEHGWSATTVGLVAERAGVSRGAAQHHFPTRDVLFTAAIDRLVAARSKEVEAVVHALPERGPQRTRKVLDHLFVLYNGASFRASVAVWSIASTDADLLTRVRPFEARLGRDVHKLAVSLLEVDESIPGVRATIQATLDFLRGLALANLLSDDSRRRRPVLDAWSTMLDHRLSELAAYRGR